jgi:two-component system cell cycle response regulator CpdR
VKILIAEDEHVIADSYKILLESRNHEVIICFDGEQCLKTFYEHASKLKSSGRSKTKTERMAASPFDLLILDYRMPKKNGMEVAEQILSKVPSQRILIASAYTHEITESKAITERVQMLQKPFEFDAFVGLVEQRQADSSKSSQIKPSRASMSMTDFSDLNVPDSGFMHTGDISDIFRLWR